MKSLAKLISALLTLAMLLSLSCLAGAESVTSAEASAMRLMRTDGSVSLSDASGASLSVREGMRLDTGYAVSTKAQSRAGLLLDDTKAVTLNELSLASLSQAGSSLELNLQHGAMYFSVSQPLDADESYSIRTSTMVLGIRGTSGYVETISDTESAVTLTSGSVNLSLLTGGELPLSHGQRMVLTSSGGTTQFSAFPVTPFDFPGLLLAELISDRQILDECDAQNGNGFKEKVLAAAAWHALLQGDYSLFAGNYSASNSFPGYSDLVLNPDGSTKNGTKNGSVIRTRGVPVSVTLSDDGAFHCVILGSGDETPETRGRNFEYYDIYTGGAPASYAITVTDPVLVNNIVIHYVTVRNDVEEDVWYIPAGDPPAYASYVTESGPASDAVAAAISSASSVTNIYPDPEPYTAPPSVTAVPSVTSGTSDSGTGSTGTSGGSSGSSYSDPTWYTDPSTGYDTSGYTGDYEQMVNDYFNDVFNDFFGTGTTSSNSTPASNPTTGTVDTAPASNPTTSTADNGTTAYDPTTSTTGNSTAAYDPTGASANDTGRTSDNSTAAAGTSDTSGYSVWDSSDTGLINYDGIINGIFGNWG